MHSGSAGPCSVVANFNWQNMLRNSLYSTQGRSDTELRRRVELTVTKFECLDNLTVPPREVTWFLSASQRG
jgi:hypothetical protein